MQVTADNVAGSVAKGELAVEPKQPPIGSVQAAS